MTIVYGGPAGRFKWATHAEQEIPKKVCPRCKRELDPACFRSVNEQKIRYHSVCKDCAESIRGYVQSTRRMTPRAQRNIDLELSGATKICNVCGQIKSVSEFYQRYDNPEKLRPACKACESKRISECRRKARERKRLEELQSSETI